MTEEVKKSRKSNPNRGAKPGERRGGRMKGTPNKQTTEVKQALIMAFEGIGGVPALTEWAKSNRTEFMKLWVKIMPAQVEVSGKDGQPIEHKRTPVTVAEAAAMMASFNRGEI